jgi:cell division protein FtsQ
MTLFSKTSNLGNTDKSLENTMRKSPETQEKKSHSGGKLFMMVLITAIAAGIALGSYFNRMTYVKSIEVTGNYYTDHASIVSKAAIPINISPDSISFLETIERIETLPYIKEAMLLKRPSGKMEIKVLEREPVGLLINGSKHQYFDADGIILPVVAGKSVDVPLVYGLSVSGAADTLKSQAFQDIRSFLIIAKNDVIAASTLSEIAWTEDEGIVALSTENGIRIVFGAFNLAEGIRNWNLFYSQVIAIRGPSEFSTVDLRYNGQIVTRES